MRSISIDKIKGDEILARDIYSNNDIILISAGTKLRKEYVERLKELRIREVLIEEELPAEIDKITEEIITNQFETVLKTTMKKYANTAEGELEELVTVAEEVMQDVISQPEIMYTISRARDNSQWLYAHMLSVSALSVLIALRAGFPKKKVREISIGAILHDIGFLHVNVSCQDKPLEEFSIAEQTEIKKHVIYGYNDVENVEWVSPTAKEIVLYHHERENGSGYPFRKNAEHTKREIKVVALCDEFDSLVYGYQCRKMKVHEAIDYIVSNAGIKFDFDLVQTFIMSVAAYPTGTKVKTNENEIGMVIRQNYHFPTRPVIRILVDANGRSLANQNIEKDLKENLTLFIENTIEDD